MSSKFIRKYHEEKSPPFTPLSIPEIGTDSKGGELSSGEEFGQDKAFSDIHATPSAAHNTKAAGILAGHHNTAHHNAGHKHVTLAEDTNVTDSSRVKGHHNAARAIDGHHTDHHTRADKIDVASHISARGSVANCAAAKGNGMIADQTNDKCTVADHAIETSADILIAARQNSTATGVSKMDDRGIEGGKAQMGGDEVGGMSDGTVNAPYSLKSYPASQISSFAMLCCYIRRRQTQRAWIFLLALAVLIFACGLLLLLRNVVWMTAPSCAGCSLRRFESPTLISLTLAIGNFSCLAYFHIDRLIAKWRGKESGYLDIRTADDDRPPFKIIHWLPSAVCDYASNVLMTTSLNALAASIIMVLRGTILCQCALITVFVLRRDLKVHHWLGILVITGGAILIGGMASHIDVEDDDATVIRHLSGTLATMLMLGSCSLIAVSLFLQEYVIRRHHCPAFQSVGYIGMWESIIAIIFIPIAHYMGFDSFTEALHKISAKKALMGWLFLVYLVGSLFAALSLCLTTTGAVLVTSAVMTMAVVPTWIAEQILHWSKFSIWSLIGIATSVIGFVAYNGFLKTRWPAVNLFLDTYVIIRCDIYGADGQIRHGSLSDDDMEDEKRSHIETRHDLGACTSPISHHTTTSPTHSSPQHSQQGHYLQSVPSRVAIINADKFQDSEDDMIGDAWILVRLSEENIGEDLDNTNDLENAKRLSVIHQGDETTSTSNELSFVSKT